MKEVHLTNASIPGVRYLREMKASTNKRRRDTTYAMSVKTKITTVGHLKLFFPISEDIKKPRHITRGNRNGILVIIAEQTRHSIASSLEGKLKNHPAQCIPPNTTPTTNITKTHAFRFMFLLVE